MWGDVDSALVGVEDVGQLYRLSEAVPGVHLPLPTLRCATCGVVNILAAPPLRVTCDPSEVHSADSDAFSGQSLACPGGVELRRLCRV